jgi:hypothetical protein
VRHIALAVVAALIFSVGCTPPPPELSPQAKLAYRNTQVLKTLDLLRDTAIAANEQTPPLVTTDATRKVVNYHKTVVTTMNALQGGWQTTALTGLDELQRNLPPDDARQLAPYIALVRIIIMEVPK